MLVTKILMYMFAAAHHAFRALQTRESHCSALTTSRIRFVQEEVS